MALQATLSKWTSERGCKMSGRAPQFQFFKQCSRFWVILSNNGEEYAICSSYSAQGEAAACASMPQPQTREYDQVGQVGPQAPSSPIGKCGCACQSCFKASSITSGLHHQHHFLGDAATNLHLFNFSSFTFWATEKSHCTRKK